MDNQSRDPHQEMQTEYFLGRMFFDQSMTKETYESLIKLNPYLEASLNTSVYNAVRAGNY